MAGDFSLSTQYELGEFTIDGKDVIGLFKAVNLYESIFSPIITGDCLLLESDSTRFIEENEIEGNEDIVFSFTNSRGEELRFEGVLNGMKDKVKQNANTMYAFEFTSKEVWKNEQDFVTKRFNNVAPQDIVSEMIERIKNGPHGEEDKMQGNGEPMSFLGSRKRPTDIIKYVLTHGISTANKPDATDNGKAQEETAKGTTGFLFWQTIDGYRFCSVDDVLKGVGGNPVQEPFIHRLQQRNIPMEEAMQSIVTYDFKKIGDMQTNMRAGAFKNCVISFDMDKGLYKEIVYDDDKNKTDKQKEAVTKPTRYLYKPYVNDRFEQTCEPAKANQWDQSRRYMAQNTVRQNTFADQYGSLTLPPQFELRAGDTVEAKLPRVESEKSGGYNEKHSGRYIVKQVGHHIYSDGKAYTKVSTVRSTIQQDDASSTKS